MRAITILFLNDSYPINNFITEYVKYRGKPTHNLNVKYIFTNGSIIPIQFIADNKMNYIINWCIKEFKIVKNLKTKKYE